MRFASVLLLFMSLAAFSSAHADTYGLFDLNANLANGGTMTGYVSLDLDTTPTWAPNLEYADLIYTLNGTLTYLSGHQCKHGRELSRP